MASSGIINLLKDFMALSDAYFKGLFLDGKGTPHLLQGQTSIVILLNINEPGEHSNEEVWSRVYRHFLVGSWWMW
jgi:hypothetical protein